MMPTRKLQVFAASPGDVGPEREALGRAVSRLNRTLGPMIGATIELVAWETHTWPGSGGGAQAVINAQIGPYDIFVGMMWKRLGTPTGRAPSGTVEEFERAYAHWKEHGVPHLMFYFSRVPFYPGDEAAIMEMQAVRRFEDQMTNKAFVWGYDDPANFEEIVHDHLHHQILASFGAPAEPRTSVLSAEVFQVPALSAIVHRPEVIAELGRLCEQSPIVTIEGLAGSGKTFLAADSLHRVGASESTLWYVAAEGSTLDDAMNHVGTRVPMQGASDLSKAKELLQLLERDHQRLVIDDFHLAHSASFLPLLEAASLRPAPVKLIVISRNYVELPPSAAPMSRLTVPGLDATEIRTMLAERGLPGAAKRWIDALQTKLGGLPLAVTLFAAAIREFDHHGDELLQDTMMSNDRLRRWINQIQRGLPDDSKRLLQFLSAASGPFDRWVVRMACRHLEFDAPNSVFQPLQRAHLVVRHSQSRWSVHQLIAAFCLETAPHLDEVHGALAEHYLTLGEEHPNQPLGEKTFGLRVIACRHLQIAHRHRDAQQLLGRLAPTAKSQGHFDSFVRLCEAELEDRNRDPWIDYHYAHCCLTLGRLTDAGLALRARSELPTGNPDLELQLARLQAEFLFTVGQHKSALRTLETSKAFVEHDVKASVWAQALGTEARIRLAMGQAREVERIAKELLAGASRRGDRLTADDRLAAAIAHTYLGRAHLALGRTSDAIERFEDAAKIFRHRGYRRGLAWALAGLAEAHLADGDIRAAIRPIREALRIRSDIAECSPEYLGFIERIRIDLKVLDGSSLIREEERRVRRRLESERNAYTVGLARR
jgi:tetratricopeptide (TPR) repeat protein